jgi:hypothetical protein
VVEVFNEVNGGAEEEIRARFRRTRSYQDLLALLAGFGQAAGSAVLALGCGSAFDARPSGFVAETVRTVFAAETRVERIDLSPELPAHYHAVADARSAI